MTKGKPFNHYRAKREENVCNQYQLEHAKRAIPNDKTFKGKLLDLDFRAKREEKCLKIMLCKRQKSWLDSHEAAVAVQAPKIPA